MVDVPINLVLCGLLSLKIIVRVCIQHVSQYFCLLRKQICRAERNCGRGNISSELVHGVLFCNRSGNIQVQTDTNRYTFPGRKKNAPLVTETTSR